MADMTELTSSALEAQSSAVRGRGVQSAGTGLPGVPSQVRAAMPEVADASLDFVVAGPDWWRLPEAIEWAREWRRCLRQDGQVAIVVEGEPNAVQALGRLLGWEAGLDVEPARRLEAGAWLVRGRRQTRTTLRRLLTSAGHEVVRPDRPPALGGELCFDLACLLLQAGEGRPAAELFGQLVARTEGNLEARVGFALALAAQAEWDEARKILEQVLRTDPKHGLAAEWLRRCRERSGGEGDGSVLVPQASRSRRGVSPRT
jgi:hypothetical protein